MTDPIDLDAPRVLVCTSCGADYPRPVSVGGSARPFPRCPDCQLVPEQRSPEQRQALYGLALAVTRYRLAIEQAVPLMRTGRYDEALAALETVTAPTR